LRQSTQHLQRALAVAIRLEFGAYLVSANNSRPISMRRISLVPAPISYS